MYGVLDAVSATGTLSYLGGIGDIKPCGRPS